MKYDKEFTNFEDLGYLVLSCSGLKNYSDNEYAVYEFFDRENKTGLGTFTGVFLLISYTNKENIVDTYLFDRKIHSNAQQLIDAMIEHNKSLTIPSYFFDPYLTSTAMYERAFNEYMKLLGYEGGGWDDWGCCMLGTQYTNMYLRNIYGEKISKITLSMSSTDKDTESGEIIRFIDDGWRWVSAKFTGYGEMIAAINSVVGPEVILNAAKGIGSASNMTDSRKYDNTNIAIITPAFTVMKNNLRKEAIRILENELKKLKEEDTVTE